MAKEERPIKYGLMLSTRESFSRAFAEYGIVMGQAVGVIEPVEKALDNLSKAGKDLGLDAVIALRLLHYPAANGEAVIAYGTGIKWLEAKPDIQLSEL